MLPLQKTPPKANEPKHLLIYSQPKVGKTSLCARLPDHLILSFDKGGSDYVESNTLEILGLSKPNEEEEKVKQRQANRKFYLQEVTDELEKLELKDKNPYKFIILDTTSTYEEVVEYYALIRYMKSSMGKYFNRYHPEDVDDLKLAKERGKKLGDLKPKDEWKSLKDMPNGAGYEYIRTEFKFWIEKLRGLSSNLILLGHVRDKYLGADAVSGTVAKELNLTGKLKDIVTANLVDATAYMYRKELDTILSFLGSEQAYSGTRLPNMNLQSKDFTIASSKTGELIVDWSEIYPSTK